MGELAGHIADHLRDDFFLHDFGQVHGVCRHRELQVHNVAGDEGQIGRAAQKRAVLALADHQIGTTLRARFALECVFVGRKEVVIDL